MPLWPQEGWGEGWDLYTACEGVFSATLRPCWHLGSEVGATAFKSQTGVPRLHPTQDLGPFPSCQSVS